MILPEKYRELGFDVVLPSHLLINSNLEPSAKLLYGMIRNLTKLEGYCFATNRYLADLMDVDVSTIKRWLDSLEKEGYIERKNGEGFNPPRFIYLSDNFKKCLQRVKNEPPPAQKCAPKEDILIKKEELKESSLKRAKEKSAKASTPSSSFFAGKFEDRIQITQEQMNRLLEKFKSQEVITEYAEKLYRYSFKNEKKFKDYKRHDMVIEEWIEKDIQKKETDAKTALVSNLMGLSEEQKSNYQTNCELVDYLKQRYPEKCNALYIFHKDKLIRDPSKPNGDICDISALISTESIKNVLRKWYGWEA